MKEFIQNMLSLLTFSFDEIGILTAVFRLLIFLAVFGFSWNLIRYFREYKIFSALFLRIKGNTAAYDKIRREQMQKYMAERGDAFLLTLGKTEKNIPLINKVYETFYRTGLAEKFPGMSESGLLIILGCAIGVIFLIFLFKRGLLAALVICGGLLLVAWYLISMLAYNRRLKVEDQLLQFINACASASSQYSSVIDIFGAVYYQFSEPLSSALEQCYVEAKTNVPKETAIRHLTDKFDSAQFSFVVDNLMLCSEISGDYYGVALDISDTVGVYAESHKRKVAALRSAKVNISVMAVMLVIILYALSFFVSNLWGLLLGTSIGNIAIAILIMIYFFAMNMRAEK
jgi:Flp pilus assembly protein TadB